MRNSLCCPGMLCVDNFSRMAEEHTAAYPDRLRCTLELDAICGLVHSPIKANGEGSLALKLDGERKSVFNDGPRHRGEAVHILEGSREFCTILLQLQHTLFRAQTARPKDLPLAGNIRGLARYSCCRGTVRGIVPRLGDRERRGHDCTE